jgi:membrane protease YdiL (CAAX protease family)
VIGVGRLAALLVRYRLRSTVNAVRARPSGPFTLLLLFGAVSAVAYVGLFATALGTIAERAGPPAQVAALGLMAGAIALASLGVKSSGEGLFAGTPENEFLLALPISLPRLVGARCLAALVTDPFGTLFLLPVLLAGALAWDLPAPACLVAIATSLLAQLGISALAQATQVAVVRWIPRRRRTAVFVLLRLASAVTMAAVWISATSVLRTPALLVRHLATLQRTLDRTPVRLLVAPLAAYRRAGGGAALLALLPLVVVAAAVVAAALAVVARAGMRGWEEAGAPWAESGTIAPAGPPLTLVRREWRLLARDRPRLVALVALPVLLLGVQWFGTVGWSTATATLDRVAMLTFSITVYLAALGPLGHMQHERRAFWIVRSAPLSVGRLLRAKAAAWVVIVAGAAIVLFAALALTLHGPSPADIVAMGAMVVAGAITTTILAVGLGGVVADLSDEHRSALGPGAVYLFLLLGGLLNIVFRASGWDLFRVAALYLLSVGAFWRTGVAQVEVCLDPDAHRRRELRLADAAMLLLVFALVPVALGRGMARAAASRGAIAAAHVGVLLAIGLVAAKLLRGRRAEPADRRAGRAHAVRTIAIGLATGVGARLLRQALFGAGPDLAPAFWRPSTLALLVGIALAEELVLRGVVQGAVENEARASFGLRSAPWLAAAAGIAVAQLASPHVTGMTVLLALGPSLARAASGGVLGACAARLVILLGG